MPELAYVNGTFVPIEEAMVPVSMWSEETLQSYRNDLITAKENGVKYARMENRIPPLKLDPIIDEIAQLQLEDQREMFTRYPKIMGKGRPLVDVDMEMASFITYLKGELETYSERTLNYLLRDIQFLKEKGENGSERLYHSLVQILGFKSIDELEDVIDKDGKIVREKIIIMSFGGLKLF